MMRMTRKQKRVLIAKLISFLVHSPMFFGVFFMYGSVGALEVGQIDFPQFFVQCAIGLILIVFSGYAHHKIYEED